MVSNFQKRINKPRSFKFKVPSHIALFQASIPMMFQMLFQPYNTQMIAIIYYSTEAISKLSYVEKKKRIKKKNVVVVIMILIINMHIVHSYNDRVKF